MRDCIPRGKQTSITLRSRKTKILWGYCYSIGSHHNQKLFLFGKWFSQDGQDAWKKQTMHFLVLASLLCMTAQRTIGVIQTLPGLCTHTLTPPPLTALFPKMHTWALAFMCLGKLCTIPFFSSFQLDSSVIIKGKAADKSSSMYMKLNSSIEHSQQNLQCCVLPSSRPWTLWMWGLHSAVLEDPSTLSVLPAHGCPQFTMGASPGWWDWRLWCVQ